MRVSYASSLFASLSLLFAAATAAAQDIPIESLVARCHAGEVLACSTAGARYQLGRGVAQNNSLAVDLYTRGCDGGAMIACGLLGAFYADGLGATRDDARATVLFRRACDGGHEHSCGQLGVMVLAGRGTTQSLPGSAPLLERGCAANHYRACEVLGRMHIRGIGVGVDIARGQALLQRACTNGVQSACGADNASIQFAAPPPVTGATTFAAPPPVTGAPTYAAPPPVNAPPPRVVVTAPPRVVYVPRTTYVRTTPEGVSGSASSVSFLGGEHRASSYYLGGDFSVVRNDDVGRSAMFVTGFRHSRGPIEFLLDARFGGGELATNLRRNQSWGTFGIGAGLGLNILSWPRSDRERFSIINLSAGVNTAFGFSVEDPGSSLRVGGYVANTLYFLCWMGVRTEFTGSFVGADTWGHTFSASLFFGGRPSYQCR